MPPRSWPPKNFCGLRDPLWLRALQRCCCPAAESLPPGLRKPPRQKLVEGLQLLQPTVLPCPHFAQVPTQFPVPKRVSRSASDLRSQARISSILVSTNRARLRLSLRSMGGILVCKLVKPTKVFCSRAPHQRRFGQILSPQTEPDVATTGAGVLGKADATVGQKLGGFDPSDRVLDQSPEFFALVVVDRGPEVLNLDQPLADENHLSHVGNTCDPGIANQLRVKSQQPSWFLRISAGRGLPFQQAASAVQIADGIHIGYEVVLATQGLGEFDLQVATRLADANPIVLRKAIKQLHPRLQHAVPAIALGVVKCRSPGK